MYINNRWYTETEVKAYVDKLIEENEELKELLKAAVKCIDKKVTCNLGNCDKCASEPDYCDYDSCFIWKYRAEALALIGEDGERNE